MVVSTVYDLGLIVCSRGYIPLEMVVHTLDSLDFNVERKELYADREIESV